MKKFLTEIFQKPNTRRFVIANDLLVVLILLSVLVIVLESVEALSEHQGVFAAFEYFAVVVFTFEYIGRIIAAPKKLQYVFSFYGIVDLLAILPTYLGLANFTFIKTTRVLRIMRFLRMIRLTKLARIKRTRNDIEDYADLYKLNILLYVTALSFSVLFLGTLVYLFEASGGVYTNIPLGMQWALETILGGSISATVPPQTVGGEIVTILTRFIGLVLLGLLLTVIGSTVQRIIFGTSGIKASDR